jgi:hypothetical protein
MGNFQLDITDLSSNPGYEFQLLSVPSPLHVTMADYAWMESTALFVTAQTRDMKDTSVRITLMTVLLPHAPMELSATMALRTIIAVVLKAMQVCNRELPGQM